MGWEWANTEKFNLKSEQNSFTFTILNMTKKLKRRDKSDLSYIKEDKMMKKIEKYVDKNREKTSQKIMERKNNRVDMKWQEGNLELMISRIYTESNATSKTKSVSKSILYIIYTIIIILILIFIIKYFSAINMPQIS